MPPARPRFLSWLPATLAIAILAGGCSDSSGTTEPTVNTISIQPVASQMSIIATGDDLTEISAKSISQLADDIAKVMASKGGLSGDPSALRPFLDGAPGGGDVTSWMWTPAQDDRARGNETVFGATISDGVFASPAASDVFGAAPPLPPLGITCVWNLDTDAWGGSENVFGTPPGDGIRFELYDVINGLPIEPLAPLQTYIDVRPRQQSSETGEPVNVVMDVALKGTTNKVLSYVLAGNSDPDANILDLLMAGNQTSAGGSLMDFVLAIDSDRASTSIRVQDLIINSSLEVLGSTVNAYQAIRKVGSPRQLVEFDYTLSGSSTISTGSVIIDNVPVASMAGGRFLPTWTIVDDGFTESDNLNIIYDALLLIDSGINTQFFFSHCVGADHPSPCADMLVALGL